MKVELNLSAQVVRLTAWGLQNHANACGNEPEETRREIARIARTLELTTTNKVRLTIEEIPDTLKIKV